VCACQSSWSCGLVSSSSRAAARKCACRAAFWQSNTMSSSLVTPTACVSWRASAVLDRSDDGCASHPSDELVERTEFSMFPFGRITQRGFRAREVEQVGAETHDLLGRPKLAGAQPACGRRIAAHVTQRAPRTACRQSAPNGGHTIPLRWAFVDFARTTRHHEASTIQPGASLLSGNDGAQVAAVAPAPATSCSCVKLIAHTRPTASGRSTLSAMSTG